MATLPRFSFTVKLYFPDESTVIFKPESFGPLTIGEFHEKFNFLLEGAMILRSVPVRIDIRSTLVGDAA